MYKLKQPPTEQVTDILKFIVFAVVSIVALIATWNILIWVTH